MRKRSFVLGSFCCSIHSYLSVGRSGPAVVGGAVDVRGVSDVCHLGEGGVVGGEGWMEGYFESSVVGRGGRFLVARPVLWAVMESCVFSELNGTGVSAACCSRVKGITDMGLCCLLFPSEGNHGHGSLLLAVPE